MEDNEISTGDGPQDRPNMNRSGTVPEPFTNGYSIAWCEGCGNHIFSLRGFHDVGILIARCCVCDREVQFITNNIMKYCQGDVDA